MALYALGAPGGSPRIIMSAPTPEELSRQLQGGEICLPIDTIGAHRISDDGLSALPLTSSIEEQWAEVRRHRDALLAQSDWTQLPDVPAATRVKWQSYRQALRDITTAFAVPDAIVWPSQP